MAEDGLFEFIFDPDDDARRDERGPIVNPSDEQKREVLDLAARIVKRGNKKGKGSDAGRTDPRQGTGVSAMSLEGSTSMRSAGSASAGRRPPRHD